MCQKALNGVVPRLYRGPLAWLALRMFTSVWYNGCTRQLARCITRIDLDRAFEVDREEGISKVLASMVR